MNWKVSKEELPAHNKSVIISHGGSYNIASFDKFKKGFQIKNGNFLPADNNEVLWSVIVAPERKP
jgi:hypothetical protein